MTSRTPSFVRRKRICGVLVALSLLPFTACTGQGTTPGATAAPESSSATASPPPTSTPTPTAIYKPADATGRAQNVPVPVLPEAAKAETKEGAIAFAKHWYTVLNYAYQTGDFVPLDAVTGSGCRMCAKVRPGIIEWNSDGRWIAGGLVTVKGAFTEFVKTAEGNYQVTTQLEQPVGFLYRPDSSIEKSVAASQVLADIMTVSFTNGNWHALDVDRLSS